MRIEDYRTDQEKSITGQIRNKGLKDRLGKKDHMTDLNKGLRNKGLQERFEAKNYETKDYRTYRKQKISGHNGKNVVAHIRNK